MEVPSAPHNYLDARRFGLERTASRMAADRATVEAHRALHERLIAAREAAAAASHIPPEPHRPNALERLVTPLLLGTSLCLPALIAGAPQPVLVGVGVAGFVVGLAVDTTLHRATRDLDHGDEPLPQSWLTAGCVLAAIAGAALGVSLAMPRPLLAVLSSLMAAVSLVAATLFILATHRRLQMRQIRHRGALWARDVADARVVACETDLARAQATVRPMLSEASRFAEDTLVPRDALAPEPAPVGTEYAPPLTPPVAPPRSVSPGAGRAESDLGDESGRRGWGASLRERAVTGPAAAR